MMDGHKLMYHPDAMARWMEGATVFPLYVEISPSGGCNHRCTFCALDFMGYLPRFLDAALLADRLAEMGRLGVRSVMFGGEGEPLLHPQLGRIVACAKESGLDAALVTNGVLLAAQAAEGIVPHASWIRISLNAGTAATFAAIHRAPEGDFATVLGNLRGTARMIAATGFPCALGVQSVLLPENAAEMETLARLVRDAGADYLVIKPYSQHPRSLAHRYREVDYAPYLAPAERLASLSDHRFEVVFRLRAMQKLGQDGRGYGRCLALPFWAYVDAGGGVWGCGAHLGDPRFLCGSLVERGFEEIWLGEGRQGMLAMVERMDPGECRPNCRMDEVNRYLWMLAHPPRHVNFV